MKEKIINTFFRFLVGIITVTFIVAVITASIGFLKGLLFVFTFKLNIIQIILLAILSYLIGYKYYK